MPYAQDIVTRIINVQWGGGAIFVIGDSSGFIWRCQVPDKTSDPTKLTFEKVGQIGPQSDDTISFAPPGFFAGSSYATVVGTKGEKTSVFLLCGTQFRKDVHTLFTNGVIMQSESGSKWTTVFDKDSTLASERWEPRELVWDAVAQKFYCWMTHTTAIPIGADPTKDSQCWSSPDGKIWTQIGSVDGDVRNPDFESHCRFKYAATGMGGKGLPDGKFGFDPNTTDLDSSQDGRIVTDPVTHEEGHIISEEDLPDSNAVSLASGIWGRGGYSVEKDLSGAFDVSVDGSHTWKFVGQVFQYEQPITGRQTLIGTVIAGSQPEKP